MSIYVEILMRTTMDKLWHHTQTPEFHARWDLRFSAIDYLPRPDENEPQQFLYSPGKSARSPKQGDNRHVRRPPSEELPFLALCAFLSERNVEDNAILRYNTGAEKRFAPVMPRISRRGTLPRRSFETLDGCRFQRIARVQDCVL